MPNPNLAIGDHFPNREATLGQALAKYLEVADLEVSTREAHEGYIRRTIGPVLGEVKIRKLGADSLDSLYTALKKCSRLCRRLPRTEHHADGEHACDARCGPLRDHRTTRPHACDSRCRPHQCKPAWAGATGVALDAVTGLARRARSGTPDWFMSYKQAEAQASILRCWSPVADRAKTGAAGRGDTRP